MHGKTSVRVAGKCQLSKKKHLRIIFYVHTVHLDNKVFSPTDAQLDSRTAE